MRHIINYDIEFNYIVSKYKQIAKSKKQKNIFIKLKFYFLKII